MIRMALQKAVSASLLIVALACGGAAEPELVDKITLDPDSVIISPGEVATFSATPISERGTRLEDRAGRVSWRIGSTNLSGETADGATLAVTAQAVGTGWVFASLGEVEQPGLVHVQPAGLARIEVYAGDERVDSDYTFTTRGAGDNRRAVQARLFDADGNELSPNGFRISWDVGDNRNILLLGDITGSPITLTLNHFDTTTDVQLVVGNMRKTVRIKSELVSEG